MDILTDSSDYAKDQYIASLVTSIEQYRTTSFFALSVMKYTGLTEDYYGQVRMCMFCGKQSRTIDSDINHATDCSLVIIDKSLADLAKTTF